MARMLSEFGDCDDVLHAIGRNIDSFSWSGSLTKYYALYEQPTRGFLTHRRPRVRRWAQRMLRQLSARIKEARNEDEERQVCRRLNDDTVVLAVFAVGDVYAFLCKKSVRSI